jgi:hypothetical protein
LRSNRAALRSNLQPQIINVAAQHHDLHSQIANLTLQICDLRVQLGVRAALRSNLCPQIASCNLQWVNLTWPFAIAAQTTALSPASSGFPARH